MIIITIMIMITRTTQAAAAMTNYMAPKHISSVRIQWRLFAKRIHFLLDISPDILPRWVLTQHDTSAHVFGPVGRLIKCCGVLTDIFVKMQEFAQNLRTCCNLLELDLRTGRFLPDLPQYPEIFHVWKVIFVCKPCDCINVIPPM